MNNAGLSRQGESTAMASYRKSLKFDEVAADMRRLFGSRGSGGRQDLSSTEEAVEPLERDEDQDARAAYKRAKKQCAGKQKKDGGPRPCGAKWNGFNSRTGRRNRRRRCVSEYHLAPKCP